MRINLCLLLFLVLLNISCNSKRAGKKEDVEKDNLCQIHYLWKGLIQCAELT